MLLQNNVLITVPNYVRLKMPLHKKLNLMGIGNGYANYDGHSYSSLGGDSAQTPEV
jgi:hypothetical protein